MKKIYSLLLITLFAGTFLIAQDMNNSTTKKKRVYFGVKTGMNITHFNLKDMDDEKADDLDSKWRTGFVLGAFAKIPVYESFSIQPEFLYSSMGGDYEDNIGNKTGARYNYFSIPILFKLGFCKRWAVVAGPQFDVLIQGKESVNSQKFDVSAELKDHDILVTGGVEYWPWKCVVLGARYMKGFKDVDARTNAVKFYQEGVQATIGLKF